MADLADVATDDIITATRQNDINDYIHDGAHKINTLSIDVGGTEVITSGRALTNITLDANGTGNTISNIDLSADVTGTLPVANGGTGATTATGGFDALSPMTTAGDVVYGGASGTVTRLGIGTAGQVLTTNSGATAPEWADASGGVSNAVKLTGQTIDGSVSTGDPVYLNGGTWKLATTEYAAGVYDGTDVVTHGYVDGLSGLTENSWYAKDSSGNLISLFINSEQSIGYAISSTELIVSLGVVTSYGNIGVFAGGSDAPASNTNIIDYINIASTGDATDFGDLTYSTLGCSGCSSSTRGIFGGGTSNDDTINYITFFSLGNATDFGNLSVGRNYTEACSSSTRGVFGGGVVTSTYQNVMDYITIASTGNATDFGDLQLARQSVGGCGSSTRGIFGGGWTGNPEDEIDYITIASTGNGTDFGNLSQARGYATGCSSDTRGLFMSGFTASQSGLNTIDYITIASTGNATDFGDTGDTRFQSASCSSLIRGIIGGGYKSSTYLDVIEYVTIASTGNATDFGDLTSVRANPGATSNCHGGLV